MNPNADRNAVDSFDINNQNDFPKFLKSVEFEPFRHIKKLRIDFNHPITVLTGNNRIGKSTILMAIACSHYQFNKRNPSNGILERFTWGSIMRFTQYDKQTEDWTYFLEYRQGDKIVSKRGQRKAETNKWNGVAKKESQITDRQVVSIDLERIDPARNASIRLFHLAKLSTLADVSYRKKKEIFEYLSYILEEDFEIMKIVQHLDRDVFKFKNTYEYSSFNSASGEDVLTRILIDIVEAELNSLILIDEIELGLHPKVQRRLADVIYNICRKEKKQFILTTHSPAMINAFNERSRIFIERNHSNEFKAIHKISVNAALTKMDSLSYPLVNLFCEDEISKLIIQKAIGDIQSTKNIQNFNELINIIVSGSSNTTYDNFLVEKRTFSHKKIKTGYCCILDGDMRSKKKYNGEFQYPPEDLLFFIFSDCAPEKFLLKSYLDKHLNVNLSYHLRNSNPHILFKKMVELSVSCDESQAFNLCWSEFIISQDGQEYFEQLKLFLIQTCKTFSPEL